MKKIISFLIVLLILSCNKSELIDNTYPNSNTIREVISAFKETDSKIKNLSTRSVFVNSNKWITGETITIGFMNGSTELQNFVKKTAKEWFPFVNLKFNFVTSGNADIRIGFVWNNDWVNWSYIGSDAKNVSQNEPTMNLAWTDYDLDDEEFRASVLQQLGLMLGLGYEHKNPIGNINWNMTKVYQYFRGWTTVEVNEFLSKYSKNESTYSEYDENSIMVYALPSNLTTDGKGISLNLELSTEDKQFISDMYPGNYYNGYQHDLVEPDWGKLKTLNNNLIGVGRDIDGNYYFYPYFSGDIIKYTQKLVGQTTLASVTKDYGYRNNPQIVPQSNGHLLMRPTYGAYIKRPIQYVNLDNPLNEDSFNMGPEIGNQCAFTYDYSRSLIYNSEGAFDESFNHMGSIVVDGIKRDIQQVAYWGEKYKWVMYAEKPYTNLFFNVYEQSKIVDLLSEKNLIATIELPNVYISNGGIACVYEYNNKLVIVNFGGSGPYSNGNIIILDPTGLIDSKKYKLYSHSDAKWSSTTNYSFMCGGIFWKEKLMIYDQNYGKYYFEFQELLN